jgi:hypothetical protein
VDTASKPHKRLEPVPFISFFYIFFDLIAGTSLLGLSYLKVGFYGTNYLARWIGAVCSSSREVSRLYETGSYSAVFLKAHRATLS